MRVLVVNENLGVVGGTEAYLRSVLPRLAAAGLEPTVGYARPASRGRATAADGPPPLPAVSLAGAARAAPDVVFQHGLTDPAPEAELAARFPSVLFAHNYHGTCGTGTKCHARHGYRACDRRLGPACLAMALPLGCGGRNPLGLLQAYRGQRVRQAALRLHRAVLVASRHMRAEFRREGVPDDRLALVPYFTDRPPDPAPPAPRPPSGRLLLAGRLTLLKGVQLAAEAVARAAAALGRRLTLAVAGDGPEQGRLAADCRRHGVPTEFLGWLGPAARDEQMRAADLLLVPSLWPEPFGLVGIEAGGLGTPAAGFAAGGIPDWLAPGDTGEVGEPTAVGLADAVVRATADPAHWQRLREGAWRAAGRFTPEAHLGVLLPALRAAAGR